MCLTIFFCVFWDFLLSLQFSGASWWVVISADFLIIRGCLGAAWSNEGRLCLEATLATSMSDRASSDRSFKNSANCWLVFFLKITPTYSLETVFMVMMKVIEMMEFPLTWCWMSWIKMIVGIQLFPTADWRGVRAHLCQKPWWPCLNFERLKSFPGHSRVQKIGSL